MKRSHAVDLVRPLARRTALVSTIAAVIVAVGPPLGLYVPMHRGVKAQAASYARRMAELVRDVVIAQPDLWYYDTPKLAAHLQLLVSGPEVRQVVVIDALGRRIELPPEPEARGWWTPCWAVAPVFRGHEEVARVWVAIDAGSGLMNVGLTLLLSMLLGATLSTVLHVVPVVVVGRAERRIVDLLDRLEGARRSLTTLNEQLEQRVEQRSRQYAETAQALERSEARLRDVAARAVEATEQERRRVAHELHDGVGQLLTAVRLSVQVLRTILSPDAQGRDRLLDVEKAVDETIDELRRIAMDLHPSALDRLGMVEALEELCSSFASRSGLDVAFERDAVPGELQLPAAVENSCYRVVQEGLTNVVRYAEADRVRIALSLSDEGLTLSVADDGVGFDVDRVDEEKGLGLRGMRDRAALLGGTLSIESAAGRGTTIVMTLPLAGARPDASRRDAPGRS